MTQKKRPEGRFFCRHHPGCPGQRQSSVTIIDRYAACWHRLSTLRPRCCPCRPLHQQRQQAMLPGVDASDTTRRLPCLCRLLRSHRRRSSGRRGVLSYLGCRSSLGLSLRSCRLRRLRSQCIEQGGLHRRVGLAHRRRWRGVGGRLRNRGGRGHCDIHVLAGRAGRFGMRCGDRDHGSFGRRNGRRRDLRCRRRLNRRCRGRLRRCCRLHRGGRGSHFRTNALHRSRSRAAASGATRGASCTGARCCSCAGAASIDAEAACGAAAGSCDAGCEDPACDDTAASGEATGADCAVITGCCGVVGALSTDGAAAAAVSACGWVSARSFGTGRGVTGVCCSGLRSTLG